MPHMFGLRVKKSENVLGVMVNGNGDAEFSNSYEATLCNGGMPFLVGTREEADRVLTERAQWYSSNLSHPQIGDFSAEELEVVKILVTVIER